jgi:hypothetical protein
LVGSGRWRAVVGRFWASGARFPVPFSPVPARPTLPQYLVAAYQAGSLKLLRGRPLVEADRLGEGCPFVEGWYIGPALIGLP